MATFANGIPASIQAENAAPKLTFTRKSDKYLLTAYSNAVYLTNTVTVANTDSTSGVSVSFAGGLPYTVTKTNLLATLNTDSKANYISVCGNPCYPDAAQSDINKVVCNLPPLASVYSYNNYKIVQTGVLKGTWTASEPSQIPLIQDGNWATEFVDAKANCFIELSFPGGQVGILDSAKFLINDIPNDKKPFVNTLKLQGWDGTAYKDLYTSDASIHDGWNTLTWETGSKPTYSKYKWTGAYVGACRLGEIVFNGIVAINDSATSTVCPVKLVVGSSTTSLNDVTYTSAKTPTVTSISPRYGKVSGGEVITITGTNFVNGSTSVKFDGITCVTTSVT